jgi:uncharacterized cupin superfamily protein
MPAKLLTLCEENECTVGLGILSSLFSTSQNFAAMFYVCDYDQRLGMPKKIDISVVPTRFGTSFPPPYDSQCVGRLRYRLGDAAGLTQFGVNLLHLPPGQWSSHRHWHESDDELVYVLKGEVTLVTDAGEEVLGAGDCAGFKAGERDGHHLQNRSHAEAVVLEIGGRSGGPGE